MSNLPPKPEFDQDYPSPPRSRPMSDPYPRGRDYPPRSPPRPRYGETDRYVPRPREPPWSGFRSPPRHRGTRDWETRDDEPPRRRSARDFDDRRGSHGRPPPRNDRYQPEKDWKTRDDSRPYRRDDPRPPYASSQDRRDRPYSDRSYYDRDGRPGTGRDQGPGRGDSRARAARRSRSRSPRPAGFRGPPPRPRSRTRSRGRGHSSRSSSRHASHDRSPEKERRDARFPPRHRKDPSSSPSPRRRRTITPEHEVKAEPTTIEVSIPSRNATPATVAGTSHVTPPIVASPRDHVASPLPRILTPTVRSSGSHAAETPEPVASREKGKGKEEPMPNEDVKMEDVSSHIPAQPIEPTHVPPTGPRNIARATEHRGEQASLPTHEATTSDTRKPEEHREYPPFPVFKQPDETKNFGKAAEIASLQSQRAHAFTLYNQAVKAARRAQHEYEMGLLDLQAAEQRRAIAEEQEQLAKAGAAGHRLRPAACASGVWAGRAVGVV
ncbi:hypothetical protein EVG20_g5739 [Dentipellis fragilis]|uniref:Uncharacterized protein n=1 Tax=Dentipellis fragilis TaxID=205917 RepID=A0A4Y9YV63_9AGAM|nr:hypothetical protein EVG20_g5739 [Dentipellis fragilis]